LWHDVRNEPQRTEVAREEPGKQVILRARKRVALAEGENGSIAVFPPPHQFFFARELEVNLGYVWYRDVEWTFPLDFVEAVWGDGQQVGRKIVSATDQPPFGSHRFRIPFDAAGKQWVRFSVCGFRRQRRVHAAGAFALRGLLLKR
jgi:hypothetical protein